MTAETMRERDDHPVTPIGSAFPGGSREGRELRRLRSVATVGSGVIVTGVVLVRGPGEVLIGDGVVLDAASEPIELRAGVGASLELAAGSRLGPGVSVEASGSVRVEAGAVLGPRAKILDNNLHTASGERHAAPQSTPVVVAKGAWVGARSTLLPGSSLGAGSVLADDSVLSGRVPAGVKVAGVPARLVRRLDPDQRACSTEDQEQAGRVSPPFRELDDLLDQVSPQMLRWLQARERFEGWGPKGWRGRLASQALHAFARANGRYQTRGAQSARRIHVHGELDVRNYGRLEIGEGCAFAGGPVRTRIEVAPRAELRIGEDAVINHGSLLRSCQSIHIGDGLLLGSRVLVMDSHDGVTAPVHIGDGVWLAHGVSVLPGVTIGDGSAVSAGTVVDRDIPAGFLAVGVPLKLRPLGAVAR